MDLGAIYNIAPDKNKSVGNKAFQPQQRELVFDIDLADYDEIRNSVLITHSNDNIKHQRSNTQQVQVQWCRHHTSMLAVHECGSEILDRALHRISDSRIFFGYTPDVVVFIVGSAMSVLEISRITNDLLWQSIHRSGG